MKYTNLKQGIALLLALFLLVCTTACTGTGESKESDTEVGSGLDSTVETTPGQTDESSTQNGGEDTRDELGSGTLGDSDANSGSGSDKTESTTIPSLEDIRDQLESFRNPNGEIVLPDMPIQPN